MILVLAGCLALLAGLFGGGVKTKDIEVPTIGRVPRVLSALFGILLIGAAIWLYIRPSAPPTPVPTDTPTSLAAATDTPSPSATPVPTYTPTQVGAPTATPIPPDPTNPTGFLRYYFDLLTVNRNYSDAWQLLTKRFQRQFYSNDYAAYQGYWATVKQVNLDSVQITQVSSNAVDAHVELTILMTNGSTQKQAADYRLIYNSSARTWMFDTP